MPDDPEAPETPPHSLQHPTRVAGENDVAHQSAWRRADDTVPTLGESEETVLAAIPAPIREVLGDYEILGKLGQGGMGAVYRARQISLERQVALKLLPPTFQADPEFVTRFQREARVAASLSHGNLVKVFASGQIEGTHFIAMELIEGETLGDWLKRGPLPPVEALRILHAATSALAYGWQRANLIHRDIKPGNIFLSQRGEVKVGDLGLAKSIGGDTTGLTHTGTAMGTPHYISPEQARGEKDLDFRADIYSLGCTLYQMLTGRTPYTGTDPMSVMVQHINSPPPAILKVLPDCPLPLARLVGKMLKKQKRERHASYEELLTQIESIQALFAPSDSPLESTLQPDPDATLLATPAAAVTPAKPSSATTSTPPQKSKAVLYGSITAGIVVVGAVAFFAWPKKEPLTKAQIAMMEREAAANAVTPAPLRAIPPPVASISTGTENWQPLFTAEELAHHRNAEQKDGQFLIKGAMTKSVAPADGAIRAQFTYTAGAQNVGLGIRSSNGRSYKFLFAGSGNAVFLEYLMPDTGSSPIGRYALPNPLEDGQSVVLELRAVGHRLTALVDGRQVIDVNDDRLPTPGFWGVMGQGAISGPPQFVDLTNAAPAAPQWRDWVAERRLAGAFNSHPALRDDGASIELLGPGKYEDRDHPWRDGQARIVWALAPGNTEASLSWRNNTDPQGATLGYSVGIRPGEKEIRLRWAETTSEKKDWKGLRNVPFPPNYDPTKEHTLEIECRGDQLTVRLEGQEIISYQNSSVPTAGLVGFNGQTGMRVRKFESLSLDPNTSGPDAAIEPWQDLRSQPQKVKLMGGAEFTADGVAIPDKASALLPQSGANGALRIRGILGDKNLTVRARVDNPGRSYYTAALNNERSAVSIGRVLNGQAAKVAEWKLPQALPKGAPYSLELRAVGDRLSVQFNEQLLGEAQDTGLPDGNFGLSNYTGETVSLKAVEFLSSAH